MSSEGLPFDGVVDTEIVLGTRSTQQATDEVRGSLSADSAVQSSDTSFKYSRKAKTAVSDAVVYAKQAKDASQNAQNIADAKTYYITTEDPDGTIAGLAGTPDGKSFRVGFGDGLGFKTYQFGGSGIGSVSSGTTGSDGGLR
ncbi:hypothetical protein AB6825_04985 [Serratia proteamaculans]|uniref:hypothetical protein n=1 Tax=Serratia proteamaculans TaxID=28151 RepID=UPI00217765CC|nr:hypothetical protein [Serratia proteamaculans]CAI0925609.1 Uncharacterised protein [Serratia proteamaculans]CAI1753370.1 Uncharacterised protein [Serratia proteamaculans]